MSKSNIYKVSSTVPLSIPFPMITRPAKIPCTVNSTESEVLFIAVHDSNAKLVNKIQQTSSTLNMVVLLEPNELYSLNISTLSNNPTPIEVVFGDLESDDSRSLPAQQQQQVPPRVQQVPAQPSQIPPMTPYVPPRAHVVVPDRPTSWWSSITSWILRPWVLAVGVSALAGVSYIVYRRLNGTNSVSVQLASPVYPYADVLSHAPTRDRHGYEDRGTRDELEDEGVEDEIEEDEDVEDDGTEDSDLEEDVEDVDDVEDEDAEDDEVEYEEVDDDEIEEDAEVEYEDSDDEADDATEEDDTHIEYEEEEEDDGKVHVKPAQSKTVEYEEDSSEDKDVEYEEDNTVEPVNDDGVNNESDMESDAPTDTPPILQLSIPDKNIPSHNGSNLEHRVRAPKLFTSTS